MRTDAYLDGRRWLPDMVVLGQQLDWITLRVFFNPNDAMEAEPLQSTGCPSISQVRSARPQVHGRTNPEVQLSRTAFPTPKDSTPWFHIARVQSQLKLLATDQPKQGSKGTSVR